jgi:hypothetical protein
MKAKITPKPEFRLQGTHFTELFAGDYFIYSDRLLIKVNRLDQQEMVDVLTGEAFTKLENMRVLPVNVETNWRII